MAFLCLEKLVLHQWRAHTHTHTRLTALCLTPVALLIFCSLHVYLNHIKTKLQALASDVSAFIYCTSAHQNQHEIPDQLFSN